MGPAISLFVVVTCTTEAWTLENNSVGVSEVALVAEVLVVVSYIILLLTLFCSSSWWALIDSILLSLIPCIDARKSAKVNT